MSCSVPSVARALLSARRFKGIGSQYMVLGLIATKFSTVGSKFTVRAGSEYAEVYYELTTRTTL